MSTRTLEYQGYIGTIEVDADEGILFGKIVNVLHSGLMYEGTTIAELQENMRSAVDSYLVLSAEAGEPPNKPFSGDVRLRMDALTHARLAAAADSRGISMNQLAVEALKQAVGE
jgi:predicted HicB family RNase H-like nuclease